MSALSRLIAVAGVALLGYAAGWVNGSLAHIMPRRENYPFLAEQFPLPHHVPEHPGGLSFRFVMAHDVVMERFAKHGPAFYRERDRLTRLELAGLKPGEPAWFSASDDLAAGVERLGRSDESVAILRDKLARQRKQGLSGRDLYTSFANLGTFLIHGSFRASLAGDLEARARFREGVGLIRQSVEVNPGAHFGRERWQAAIAEFLLAAMDDPALLKTYDCLGNRLDLKVEEIPGIQQPWIGLEGGYGRPYDSEFGGDFSVSNDPAFFQVDASLDDPARWKDWNKIRRNITRVGAEEGWDKVAVPSNRKPVPFDEPVLGMIGMWRQGGGANPHFALAIGETMLRVGQRYLAWEAFERASKMADRFWPGQAERDALLAHCKRRQVGIEQGLVSSAQMANPPGIAEAPADLRSRFDAELAFGEGYQKAYQEYEASKIEAGASIDDEHFFDDFLAGREPIASVVGPEEWYVNVRSSKMAEYGAHQATARAVWWAGLAAFPTALFLQWLSWRWSERKSAA